MLGLTSDVDWYKHFVEGCVLALRKLWFGVSDRIKTAVVGQAIIKYQRRHYCGNAMRQEVLKENTSVFFFLRNLYPLHL